MRKRLTGLLATGLFLMQSSFAFAEREVAVPPCPGSNGAALPVMNEQVLKWKHNEPNQFQRRARIRGTVTKIHPDKNDHIHFEIKIGPNENQDAIEVIYNIDFGPMPPLRHGLRVEACGDFIVSTARSGPYPPSPAGAIIHWVHMNPSFKGHPPGYVWIEGRLFGQEVGRAGPKKRPGPKQGKKKHKPKLEEQIFASAHAY